MMPIGEIPGETAALRTAVAEITERLAERDALIARLRHQIDVLEKLAFGPRSEKRPRLEPDEHARQGALLFPELSVAAQRLADATGAVGTLEQKPSRKEPSRSGRRAHFPGHLPRIRTTVELPEEQRRCCGELMEELGE